MARIKSLEPLVERALEENVYARGDNYQLYVEVLRHFIHVDRLTFEEVCIHHVTLGIPALETITRCRRKIQERRPDLRDPESEKARLETESEIYAYSKRY